MPIRERELPAHFESFANAGFRVGVCQASTAKLVRRQMPNLSEQQAYLPMFKFLELQYESTWSDGSVLTADGNARLELE